MIKPNVSEMLDRGFDLLEDEDAEPCEALARESPRLVLLLQSG